MSRLHLFIAALALATSASAQEVSFSRDVLPILSDRCFLCHGPDAGSRKAELRLDDPDHAFAEREHGAAIVPGDSAASALIRRIVSEDEAKRMPPPGSGLRLTDREVETLRKWIDQGATWGKHWSYTAVSEPARPADDASNPIDSFVRAQLDAHGWTPAAPADPAALLRRLTLDLTGLPPTPDQVAAFVADPSDAHYERFVDALMASPHYGERMAWPWLEAARYADTDGFQADPTRTQWPWRDWLVRALNDNLPFDDFTIEAIAGDLLPNATREQRLASGFLRNNAHNGEGGRIAEETRVENVFDRTETMATVWMGLTFECARCHDHKYDPISQRDYYRMYAFFDQTSETGRGRGGGVLQPSMRYVPVSQNQRLAALDQEIAELDDALYAPNAELDREQAAWSVTAATRVKAAKDALQPATLSPWQASPSYAPKKGNANALFKTAFAPESDPSKVEWGTTPELRDGKILPLPAGAYAIYFRRSIDAASARRMRISLGSDDTITVWCNGEQVLAKDARRGAAPDQESVELLLEAGTNELLIKICNTGGIGGAYFRRVTESIREYPAEIVTALLAAPEERSVQERRAITRYYRASHVPEWPERQAKRSALEAERQKIEQGGVFVMVMDELPRDRRRTTRILNRGVYTQPGEPVTAGTPAFLPPLEGDANRLSLARWLVSGKHPLVARVAVNRAWQTFFGRGLVATSEDFGRQGEPPSHPRLLDWLAHRFVASGWNVKALHRLIVTSATYRQSTAAEPQRFADDPYNVRLARAPRHRLPSWMIRDQALALSGRLKLGIGGPPVRPYQPDGIWAEATFGKIRYRRDQGEALYRRSIYTFWRRIVGPTMLFDTPARQACVVRHAITNTPLHALTTLNETGYVEAARGLATRGWRHGTSASARIDWMFRAATSREPDREELNLLVRRFATTLERFSRDMSSATELLRVGESGSPAEIPAVELAAYTVVASILLNLDEVLTR